MPQWIASELGYVLCLVGFLLIVWEWMVAYRTQGNAIARNSLRSYLALWLATREPAQRAALIVRMKATAQEIRNDYHRTLFSEYIDILARLPADDELKQAAATDKAFEVGNEIEVQAIHGLRQRLIVIGAVAVVIGTLGQIAGSLPVPSSLGLCMTSGTWWCPTK